MVSLTALRRLVVAGLLVLGGVGLLAVLAARLRPAVVPESAVEAVLPLTPAPARESVSARKRSLSIAALLVIGFALPLFLPHEMAGTAFVTALAVSLAVGVYGTAGRWLPVVQRIFRPVYAGAQAIWNRMWWLVLSHRAALSWLFACAAVVLMVASAFIFLPPYDADRLGEGARYMLLGGLALGASLLLSPRLVLLPHRPALRPLMQPAALPLAPARSHWGTAAWGVVGMLFLAEVSGNLLGTGLITAVSHHAQLVMLLLSLALLVWGLGGGREGLRAFIGYPRAVSLLYDGLFLLLVTGLALFLRWWQLGTAVHFLVDEVNFVDAINYFKTDFNAPLLAPFSSLTAFPWLYPYLQAGAVGLFGRNLVGLRAVSVLMGTLTIPALYLLARALFDRKTAILAALLLAAFPPHLHFSRLGLNNIADPLFGTLALAFLARGLKHNRRMDYALGGVALGLTQYFYEGGRLLYPPLVVAWLGLGALLWRQRPPRRGLALAALAAIITAFPIYYTLLAMHMPFASRMNDAGLTSEWWRNLLSDSNVFQMQLERVKYAFAFYLNLHDGSLFYGGEQPLLLGYLVPAFLLGAFYSLWRLRAPGTLLPLLWVILTSLGNGLLIDSTQSTRYVVAFPALALLVAVGVRYGLPLLIPNGRRLRYGLSALLAGIFVVGQIAYYFGPHLDAYRQQAWFSRDSRDGHDVAFRSAGFPQGTQVHLITREPYLTLPDDATILTFLADGVYMDAMLSSEVTPEALDRLPTYVDHAFFIEPDDLTTLETLQARHILDGPQFSPYDVPISRQFILYYAHQWQQPR